MLVNLNSFKCCAFCKHWYDPANAHIQPHDAKHNMWEFEEKARCKCMLSNLDRPAGQKCSKYECKL
jgi:hypothetical protein